VVGKLIDNHDGSSSVKMKGNCFIDIDGIYYYPCLLTFFSYQSMKIIGLLKVCFLLAFIGVEFTATCAIVPYHHLSCEFEPQPAT
jgi:hypothetical protein